MTLPPEEETLPEQPERGGSRARSVAIAAGAILVLLVAGAFGALNWWRQSALPAGPANAPAVRVTVPKGASSTAVGELLEAKGVLRSARAFGLRARQSEGAIHPGTYDVSPGEAPAVILRRLRQGDIATNRVTFPEGFTLARIAERLAARGLIKDAAAFLDLVSRRGNSLQGAEGFKPPANLEGYLFPDTYEFPVDADDTAIAQRMLDNFVRVVTRENIRASGHSLAETVTIASLIEREARVAEDRARIAGVIENRLKIGMPLQIDATVQYARGKHVARLLYRDLEIDSPYNTYKIRGLPPGPICCPGLASIQAALKPEASPYLFYVARSNGSHVFGRTLAEHIHNIALVRREATAARRTGG